jgi:hypothetical protein
MTAHRPQSLGTAGWIAIAAGTALAGVLIIAGLTALGAVVLIAVGTNSSGSNK